MRSHRLTHYLLLAATWAVVTLPNLGAHSLWDMDEGVNAECAREMYEGRAWVVPTFNWELRTAKPILSYWLQHVSFLIFGVSEWSARFPSALLGLGTILVTYELGRRMFDAATALLAGIALASTLQFSLLSHAATPDAPLIFFTMLTIYLFWIGHEDGRRNWMIWPAVACGLAVLSKGPIGLALPGLTILLYFIWNRELRRVFDTKLLVGILVWALVAVPWYLYVQSETRGAYLQKFLEYENVSRFNTAMEGHSGQFYYYLGAIVVLFAPWSSLIGVTFWYAIKGAWSGLRPERFLLLWFVVYLVFFTSAATKLPNYIAPLYPALALLTARFLVRWRSGELTPAKWVMPLGVAGVTLTGVLFVLGLLIASGQIAVPIADMRQFPGLEVWALIGLVPLVAAGVMAWCVRTNNRNGFVIALAVAAVGLIGLIAAGPVLVVDQYKAAKYLVQNSGAHQPECDIRLAAAAYFQESVVFYAERRVERLYSAADAVEFLMTPRPGYLFVPEKEWEEQVRPRVTVPVRVTAKHYDFYRHAVILVVTNEP